MTREAIRFWRRGQSVEVTGFHPRTTLLDYLRLAERSVGTKEGCAEGDCGACTVALGRLKNGRLTYEPANACILLLGQTDGAEVVTVEDLAQDGLHPVQASMVANHASQCGFCTPGIVMSLFVLYQEGPRPLERQAVCDALAGNLCRCTGYRPIIDAGLQACSERPADAFAALRPATAAQLARLADGQDVRVADGTRFFASPTSEDDLARLYHAHPDATLVAGCTDVGLWITKGLAPIEQVIWLGRVRELDAVQVTAENLVIGAMVSLADAGLALGEIDPDLRELMRRFGSAQIRAAGTVGGNLANGSPIGDLAPALIALDTRLELRCGDRIRSLPLEDFFVAYRRQDREPGEFVRRVIVQRLRPDQHFRCFKVSKRFDEDISAVMGAFSLTLEGRRITAARIAFGGMAGTPQRAHLTEVELAGASLDDPSSWEAPLAAMERDYQPLSDQRASAGYRARVARNLLLKALSEISSGSSSATRMVGQRGEPVESSHG